MLQILHEVISLAAAFGAGLYAFKYMNRFFRIMYAQVIVWIVFFILLHVVTIYQVSNGLTQDNQWLMNLHMLIETSLLIAAAMSYFRDNILGKWLSVIALGAFLAVAVTQAAVSGFATYFNYADVTECISITVLYTFLLYTCSRQHPRAWWKSPEIILCLGLLLYFACSVPYIAMMHYLQEHQPVLNHLLFDLISNVLACVRYLFTAIAFLLVRRNTLTLTHVK